MKIKKGLLGLEGPDYFWNNNFIRIVGAEATFQEISEEDI